MFGRLINWAKAAFTGSPRQMLDRIYQSASGEPPERGTRELLESYETTPWFRAVGEKVGNAVASQPIKVMAARRGGKVVRDVGLQRMTCEQREAALSRAMATGGAEEIVDHPFLAALEDPNPFMGRLGLLKMTEVHLDFVGDAYWLIKRNGLGKPAGYWPIPPNWIMEHPTPGRESFRLSFRGWQDYLPENEVVWFHEAAPASPYTRGSGIGWALSDEIQVDEYAAKMAGAFFFNRARADFIFAPGTDTPETKRLEMDWLNKTRGYQRAFSPYFLAGGDAGDIRQKIYEFQQPTMEQLVYPNLRKVQRDIILQVWGVSPELFGIVENSNRATVEAAEYLFARWVVTPKLERLRGVLQNHFAVEFDERGIVHYDSPVPADKEHHLNVAKAAPHARRLDEWRKMMGLDPIGGDLGASFLVPLNSYITSDPLNQMTRPQSNPGAGRPPAETPKDNTEALAKAVNALAERPSHVYVMRPELNVTTPALPPQPPQPAPVVNVSPTFMLPELKADAPVVNVTVPVPSVTVQTPEPKPWDAHIERDVSGRIESVVHSPAEG